MKLNFGQFVQRGLRGQRGADSSEVGTTLVLGESATAAPPWLADEIKVTVVFSGVCSAANTTMRNSRDVALASQLMRPASIPTTQVAPGRPRRSPACFVEMLRLAAVTSRDRRSLALAGTCDRVFPSRLPCHCDAAKAGPLRVVASHYVRLQWAAFLRGARRPSPAFPEMTACVPPAPPTQIDPRLQAVYPFSSRRTVNEFTNGGCLEPVRPDGMQIERSSVREGLRARRGRQPVFLTASASMA